MTNANLLYFNSSHSRTIVKHSGYEALWHKVLAGLKELPEADEDELALMTKKVDKLATELDLSVFHDGYKGHIEVLIKSIIQCKYGY